MKYGNKQDYYAEMTPEHVRYIAQAQARALLDGVIGRITPDKWYAIRLSEKDEVIDDVVAYRKTMTVEIEPAQEKMVVHISPEQIHLSKCDIPLKQKLKNCIAYLRDKSGGTTEMVEVGHETNCRL